MRTLETNNCKECPHGEYVCLEHGFVNYKCQLMGMIMIDTEDIHPDCPLKDNCPPEPSMHDVICK